MDVFIQARKEDKMEIQGSNLVGNAVISKKATCVSAYLQLPKIPKCTIREIRKSCDLKSHLAFVLLQCPSTAWRTLTAHIQVQTSNLHSFKRLYSIGIKMDDRFCPIAQFVETTQTLLMQDENVIMFLQ